MNVYGRRDVNRFMNRFSESVQEVLVKGGFRSIDAEPLGTEATATIFA